MALGKPPIPGVRALQLRDVQGAIDRIRERFAAVEAVLSTASAQAGQTTLTLGQSNASISNLQRQISALVSRVDAIATPTDKLETFIAAAAIEQYDLVYVTTAGFVSPVRPSEPGAIYGAIGIATTAAASGANVVVRRAGTMQITGAVFEPGGPVYAGLDGLTQFPDYVNVTVPVGVAVGTDQLDVTPGWPALQYPGVYSEFEAFLPATWGLVRDAVELTDDFNASANGIVTKTGFGDVTTRAVTGTANRVTVTNGDGVSGNPTVDIAATYVGQTSITTLGTVTAGTWNATTIAADRGGTGVANAAGSTITLGGALSFSGAFTTAFTVTGNTSVTLPTTGTLATTAQLPAGANPTASVGLTAVNGVSTSFMRADAAPALDVGISPTWTGNHTFNNPVGIGGAPIGKLDAVGSTGTYLRVRSTNVGSDAGIGLQTGSTGTGITDGFWFLVDTTAVTIWQYENNFMRFGTNNAEVLRLTAGGAVRVVADNQELQIGASQDLRLYHDGTDSIVRNDTGVLKFQAGTTVGFEMSALGGVTAHKGIVVDGGNVVLSRSDSGQPVSVFAINSSNTASSNAKLELQVGGTSGGDPYSLYVISGGTSWYSGSDNSASATYVVGVGNTPGAADKFELTTTGSQVLGARSALATNATDGFTYIPSCAGAPTGTPTAVTGKAPIVYDTTNNRLYAYNGAWRSTAFA